MLTIWKLQTEFALNIEAMTWKGSKNLLRSLIKCQSARSINEIKSEIGRIKNLHT